MHVAVSKKADQGLSFEQYVKFLSENNYIPPGSDKWVDKIRKKGNEANHEIIISEEDDAKTLLSFVEMLLKIIFEFPAKSEEETDQE